MAEEQDEVAAYLARERAALGEDADLFASGGVPTAVDGGNDGFPDMGSFSSALPSGPAAPSNPEPTSSGPSGIDAFPDLMDEGSNNQNGVEEIRVTGHAGTDDPEREAFENQFPDIGVAAAEPSVIPYGASPYPAQPYAAPSSNTYSSILPPPPTQNILPVEEDSPAIAAWRSKQAEEIKIRDERSKAKKEETVLKAEKAIDAFYETYNEGKARSIKANKENEATFIAELSESLSKGTSWQRITDTIELQNSQSKTIRPSGPGGSDLARMKEMLLALRREGDKAPAAGGF